MLRRRRVNGYVLSMCAWLCVVSEAVRVRQDVRQTARCSAVGHRQLRLCCQFTTFSSPKLHFIFSLVSSV